MKQVNFASLLITLFQAKKKKKKNIKIVSAIQKFKIHNRSSIRYMI